MTAGHDDERAAGTAPADAAGSGLGSAELAELARARQTLDNPGLVAKLADAVGQPIEGLVRMLPASARAMVGDTVQKALHAALAAALRTLPAAPRRASRNGLHQALVGATGAVGGFFGVSGLAMELPLSTTLMLRSIAEIARSEGEDLEDTAAQLECLSVFALGGRSESDDAAESAYFAVRAGLAKALAEAAEHLAARGLTARGAPIVVRLVAQVAGRFEAAVAEKIALQSLPVVGSATGAAINLAFIRHFQAMAQAHFAVRRLERRHGSDAVREAWQQLGS